MSPNGANAILPDAIPSVMRSWVSWLTDGGGKTGKGPTDSTGRNVDKHNPAMQRTFSAVMEEVEERRVWPGVSVPPGHLVFDLDNCFTPDGKLKHFAQYLVNHTDSYTEYSPSLTGLHIFVKTSTRPDNETLSYAFPEAQGGGKLELLGPGSFVRISSKAYGNKPSEVRDHTKIVREAIDGIEAARAPKTSPNGNGHIAPRSPERSDDEILAKIRSAGNAAKFVDIFEDGSLAYHNGDESEADMALIGMLHFYTQDPQQLDRLFRRSALMRAKWDSYRPPGITYGLYTINKVIARGGDVWIPPRHNDYDSMTAMTAIPEENIPDAVEFPIEVYPPYVKKFVRETTNSIGCPTDFVGSAVLAALSTAVGNSREIVIKRDWREGANLYLCVVAGVGEKKSPVAKQVFKPIRDFQRKDMKTYQTLLEIYKQAQANKKSDPEKAEKTKHPILTSRYVDDSTVEKLCVILGESERGVIMIKDELSAWLSGMDQYKQGGKGSDRQFWLSANVRSPIRVDRKSADEPVILSSPFVSIWGGIQPGVLQTFDKDRGDGLLERFLPSFPEPVSMRWVDDEVSEETERRFADLIGDLYKLEMLFNSETIESYPESVLMTDDAKSLFIEYYNELCSEREVPGFPNKLKAVWSKLEGYSARLALILALARVYDGKRASTILPEAVTRGDMEGAIKLANYYKNHTRRMFHLLYGDSTRDRLAADFHTYIVNNAPAWEGTASELYETFDSPHKPPRPEDLAKFIRALCKGSTVLSFEDLKRTSEARHFRVSLK